MVLDVRFSHLTIGIKVTLGIHLPTCLLASYATFSSSLFLCYLKAFSGADPAKIVRGAEWRIMRGSGGEAPRKIFHDHALYSLGNDDHAHKRPKDVF